MSKKKPRAATADSIPTAPISAVDRRRIEKRIKQKHEQLRNRYREVHGKRVDWISHWTEEGILFFIVRFMDGKIFSVTYSPHVVLDTVDLSDISNGEIVITKDYYQRNDL